MPKLKLNLLDNGLDFVREGIEAIYGRDQPAPRAYKYALLHVFAGTLLLLKERIRREHASLIFHDVSAAAQAGARTVDFDEAVKRLAAAAGVVLDDDDVKLLRRVRNMRNQLEHCDADISTEHANAQVGQLVEFLERFLRVHLSSQLADHINVDAWLEVQGLKNIAEHLRQERRAAWQGRASRFESLSADELEELAQSHAYDPKDAPDQSLVACPSCCEEAVAIIDHDLGVCTNPACRQVHEVDSCHRCSCPVAGGSWLCEGCHGIFSSDD